MNSGEFTGSGKIVLGDNVDKKLGGTIKINYLDKDTFLPFLEKGSTVVLTKSTSSPNNRVIPEGVTLKIPAGITYKVWSSAGNGSLKGDIVVEGTLTARTYNESQKTYYAELGQTLKKAKDNDKIILIDDINEATISNTKKVELDLNSKKITGDIINEENATLKIYDSSEAKKGEVNGTITNKSNLILESGNYTNVPVTEEGAKTSITGGTYPADKIDKATIPDGMTLVKNDEGTYELEKLADISKLEAILSKINKLSEADYAKYTLKSLEKFYKAVRQAELLLNELSDEPLERDQAKVDEITKLLTDGFNGLVKKDTLGNTNANDNKPNKVVNTDVTNPKTGDNVMLYASLGGASLIGALGSLIYLKRKKLV